MPTFCAENYCSKFSPGYIALTQGWLGLITNPTTCYPRIANIFFISSIILVKINHKIAFGLSLTAVLFAISFLNGGEILLNEAGHTAKISKFQSGYWFWTFSMVFSLVSSIIKKK